MMNDIVRNLKLNWKSGLSVSMINIPLSISLAVASGASPLQGLLSGIWGGMAASIFSSSKHNVYGVAGALAAILFSFALSVDNGGQLLPFVAILSGIIMLFVYYFKITKYITLIPTTALHGFLIGVGISIALGQVNAALGLNLAAKKEIYLSLWDTLKHLSDVNLPAFGIFLVGFAFLVICKKYFPRFPGVIVLTILGIGGGHLLKSSDFSFKIMLLADKYKDMSFIPFINIFSLSGLNFGDIGSIVGFISRILNVSVLVAIIAVLETIISAQIATNITKEKYSKQKEVFGLGLSNIISGIMGGLPVTAVFVRTSLNINTGGKSRYSAFLIGLFTLFFSILFFNNGFMYLPYPIIAAILMNIALGLVDVKHLRELYEMKHGAFYIAFITAFFTVVEDATFGIIIGTLIALILYLKNVTASGAKVSIFRDNKFIEKTDFGQYIHKKQKDGDVILLKFDGGLNYLNQEKNIHHLDLIEKRITIVLSFSHMGYLDIDGIETINDTSLNLREKGVIIYFSGLEGEYEKMLSHTKIYRKLHKERKIMKSTTETLRLLLGNDYHSF